MHLKVESLFLIHMIPSIIPSFWKHLGSFCIFLALLLSSLISFLLLDVLLWGQPSEFSCLISLLELFLLEDEMLLASSVIVTQMTFRFISCPDLFPRFLLIGSYWSPKISTWYIYLLFHNCCIYSVSEKKLEGNWSRFVTFSLCQAVILKKTIKLTMCYISYRKGHFNLKVCRDFNLRS